MLIWGSHRDGKLGLGEKIDQDVLTPHLLPSFLPSGARVKDLSCGADHTAILADNNQVYLWGFGQVPSPFPLVPSCVLFPLCTKLTNINPAWHSGVQGNEERNDPAHARSCALHRKGRAGHVHSLW